LFVYRTGEAEWLVVPNAANVGAVASALRSSGAEPVDEWDRWAILALQGPTSFDVFSKLWPQHPALDLKLHRWIALDVFGHEGMAARTGYTGERGFELYVPAAAAVRAFEALLDAGATPVGLGARDTLRLEMGYALYGHELTPDTNPLEAGLAWAIAWDGPFRGRDRLLEIKEEGPRRRLFGVRLDDRGVPRQGYPVCRGEESIGEVCSGNFSPTLGTGIALAYGSAADVPSPGEVVEIDARGRRMKGDIVRPPFIDKGRKKS
ncbi:MAG: glycine cleavage T C-terminal barrel domain-containing protein, partial [Actinomycetota bacterium]